MNDVCLRTHQLKRQGDYWTIAKTFCDKERIREETTTTTAKVTCRECLRLSIISLEGEAKFLSERLEKL